MRINYIDCLRVLFLSCRVNGLKKAFVIFVFNPGRNARKGNLFMQSAMKRGRGTCSCRKEDLKCLASCKCDKSKCKNKVNSGRQILIRYSSNLYIEFFQFESQESTSERNQRP